jgi:hypothetical protein
MEAFGIQIYNGDTINEIVNTELIPLVKDHFQSVYEFLNKYNTFPFPLDDSVCITLLLSWEYFDLFHSCIGEIKQNNSENSITNLLSELKKIQEKKSD